MGNLPLRRQWINNWLTSDINTIVVYVISIIASIIHPMLFVIHLYRTYCKSNDLDKTDAPKHDTERKIITILKHLLNVTTLIAVATGGLATMITLINNSSVISNGSTCHPITIAQNICWILMRLCIYHVLILRLQISFWGSVYEYNRCLMFTAYCFVTCVCIVCIIGGFMDTNSVHFHTGWCLFVIPTWLILLPCILDVICGLFSLYLFMKPLKRTLDDMNLEDNESKRKLAVKVSQLISKLILLTTIAVTTNLFSGIFFAVTDIAVGSFIDTLINPICLVLMEAKHKRLYQRLCNFCHLGIYKMIFGSNEKGTSKSMKFSTELTCYHQLND